MRPLCAPSVHPVCTLCVPGQMMEASLYDKIMDQQRLEPEFFRVGFYGKKFPFFLRVSPFLSGLRTVQEVQPAVALVVH